MADNRRPPKGEAMPQLEDTAVEEDLQYLPGWERRGNRNVKTLPFMWWYSASSGSGTIIA
jgi:hypothetical protein